MPMRCVGCCLLLCLAALAGCRAKTITITSEPAGAKVVVTPIRNGVRGEGRLLGVTPIKRSLDFGTNQRYEASVTAHHFADALLEINYEPIDQNRFHVQLDRVSIDVPRIDFEPRFTVNGTQLRPVQRNTIAYLDVVERSPTVRAVTRVTGNENRNAIIGRPAMSPTDDVMAYPWITVESVEQTYIVQHEDTARSIATRLGVTIDELLAANPHLEKQQDKPVPGTVLRITVPEIHSTIWRQRVGSFARTRVTEGRWRDLDPAFTSDGNHVIFSSNRTSDNPTLWRIRLEGGGGITRITDSQAQDYMPSVSPSNGLVAYASIPHGADTLQIWTVYANGALPSQLRRGHSPRMSPDGQRMLFLRRDAETRRMQLWSMSVDGTNETQLTSNDNYDIFDPHWSPDGKWIVFASNRDSDADNPGNLDLWLMASDGTKATRLTSNASWDDCPTFDRTGRWIYFRSNRGGAWNIWRLEPILPDEEGVSINY